ncbi:hypothetical protein FACS189456_4800 [Bacteroidia bacterium]|nr:hypothetical protein FACS189456_4800 [Bacteroidia bacterium]
MAKDKKKNLDIKKQTIVDFEKIDFAGVTLNKADLEQLNKITADINDATNSIKLYPEHDIKLSILSKQLRHQYKLPVKNGINKTTLVYLILRNALADIKI